MMLVNVMVELIVVEVFWEEDVVFIESWDFFFFFIVNSDGEFIVLYKGGLFGVV